MVTDFDEGMEDPVPPGHGDDERRALLRRFLRNARERVQPGAHRLPVRQGRRTPGLRREEVAELARREHGLVHPARNGRNRRVSTRMLDRVAKALLLTDSEKLTLYSLTFPEIPSPPPVETRRCGAVDVEPLGAFARQLFDASTVPALAEAAIDFLWSLIEPCLVVSFLARDDGSDSYRCVRSRSSVRPVGPHSHATYELSPLSQRAIDARMTFCEHANWNAGARYLGAGVASKGCSGILLYADDRPQAYRPHEHERLLLVADLLSLAISKLESTG